jgi:hypothetical protein
VPAAAEAQRVPTARPGPDAAQIIGRPGFPNRDIFEVNFVAINGVNIPPRQVMWLEPGTYQITVQIVAEFTRPKSPGRPGRIIPRDPPGHNVIELELEAGKVYEIRGRFNRDDPDMPFSVILFKVE